MGQTPSPTPTPEPLRWAIYGGVSSAFTEPDPSDQVKGWKLKPGVVPSAGGEPGIFDVRTVLEATGMTFPNGCIALFSQPTKAMVLHTTQPNLDLLETIVDDLRAETPPMMKVNFSLIEYSLPSFFSWSKPAPLAYAELEKLAVGSVHLLDQATASGMSGGTMQAEHVTGVPTKQHRADNQKHLSVFSNGETGIRMKVEPTILPDQCIQFTADASFRIYLKDNDPKSLLSGAMHTESVMWNGCPIVAQSFPKPNTPGKFVALVLRFDFVNFGGWKIPAR